MRKQSKTQHMSRAEIREHYLSIVYKVVPVISILLLIGLKAIL